MTRRSQTIIGDAELMGIYEPDSPEWHEARRAGIGSSDIPILLGLSEEWGSRYKLWYEKAGLLEPEFKESEVMKMGKRLEPVIADIFDEQNLDYRVEVTGSWRNLERQYQLANPDRLLEQIDSIKEFELGASILWKFAKPLEIKNVGASVAWHWDDGPPDKVLAQLRWQMDTFGCGSGMVAALIGGNRYEQYEISVDPFWIEDARTAAREFMESIELGLPPEIDGSPHTYLTIRRLNPSLTRGAEVDMTMTPNTIGVAEAWLEAVNTAAVAERELTKWSGHMLAHMGTAQYAIYDGKRIASRVAKQDNPPYLKVQ